VRLIAKGGYNWTRRYPRRRTGSAFFFKQWGGVRKDKTGRTYRGQTFDEMPSWPVSQTVGYRGHSGNRISALP
jgi:hypothetical protein